MTKFSKNTSSQPKLHDRSLCSLNVYWRTITTNIWLVPWKSPKIRQQSTNFDRNNWAIKSSSKHQETSKEKLQFHGQLNRLNWVIYEWRSWIVLIKRKYSRAMFIWNEEKNNPFNSNFSHKSIFWRSRRKLLLWKWPRFLLQLNRIFPELFPSPEG